MKMNFNIPDVNNEPYVKDAIESLKGETFSRAVSVMAQAGAITYDCGTHQLSIDDGLDMTLPANWHSNERSFNIVAGIVFLVADTIRQEGLAHTSQFMQYRTASA